MRQKHHTSQTPSRLPSNADPVIHFTPGTPLAQYPLAIALEAETLATLQHQLDRLKVLAETVVMGSICRRTNEFFDPAILSNDAAMLLVAFNAVMPTLQVLAMPVQPPGAGGVEHADQH